ncbi:hypothetical protein niasHT_017279 [Heterodera trifolii]|uniref:DNA-directed DNA polymerase n=1 Tax=Heterodera trifolii TaxID=157864 RepID=A0ABD2LIA8_9BILA
MSTQPNSFFNVVMPPLGQVEQLVQPMFINAAHQQMPSPFCADGTHTIQFLNGSVSIVGRPLPPLCLTVVAVDHRPHQQTPAGPLPVTNVVLRNGDGQRVEASAWQQQAGALAALNIGSTYWFTNCTARARYQQLDCWYRIGVDGKNAIVVPHTAAPESTTPQNGGLHDPFASTLEGQATTVQTGAGRTVNQTHAPPAAGPIEEEDENNNTIDHRFGVPMRQQRRAAQLVGLRATRPIKDCFVIERTTPMRNTIRNTRGELCEIRFLPLEDAQRPDLVLETLIQHLLDRVLEGHPPPMLVGLQLHPPGFDRPYVIRLRPPEQNNASALAAAIERLNEQSAAGIDLLAGTTVTKVLAVWPLEPIRADAQRGGGCDFDAEHHVSNTVRSLVRVVNPNDRHCLARSVLLGLRDRETRQPNGGGRDTFAAYAGRQDQHGAPAVDLLRNAGLPVDKQMYTLEDVEQLQRWIINEYGVGQIRLVVFEKEQEYRIVFKGEGVAAHFNLCLLLERGHFNYIGRIEQLFKIENYCFDCERRATTRYHLTGCKVVCRLCLRFGAGFPCQPEQLPNGGSSSRCWYRIGVDGKNAIVVPHTAAPESTTPQNGGLHDPFASTLEGQATTVQTGAGRTVNQTHAPPAAGPIEEEDENNNTIDHRFGVPMRQQRRAAQLVGLRATRPIKDCFVIERTTPMRNTIRNTRGELCEIRFLPLEDAQRPDLVLETLIQHLLDRVLEGHPPPMLVGLQLHPPGFDRPYVIRLRPPEQNNASALAAAIERLNEQSAAGIDLLAGTTVTKVLAVWPLEPIRADAQRGGGCDFDAEHHVSNTVRSLVRVVNPNDRHCLARSVLLGLRDRETRQPNGGGRDTFAAYAGRQDQHGAPAVDLLRNAGLPVDKQMYTLEDVEQLQRWIINEYGVGQIRLVVFEKEQEYRIVFKGEGVAAHFNLCLLLERGHFNYIGRIEQLFKIENYCFDCERRATTRYHLTGCKVVCRLCLRFGAGFPCQPEQLPNGGSSSRRCNECGFVFPNDGCYDYHLANMAPAPIDGRGQRQRQPICQWRRFCRACGRVAYFGVHQCAPLHRPAGPIDCRRCHGRHTLDEPCFIQPLLDRPAHQNNNNNNNNDDDDDDDDDADILDDDEADDELPLRLCFFDAETSQERPLQLNNQIAQKHVPLLIVAEVICEPCLRAGISVNDGFGRRAPDCVCLCRMVRGQQLRQWSSPPFVNEAGDNTVPPNGAPTFNQRRFYFHSFDNEANDPIEQFLLFLMKHGSKKAHTVCIAHNGGKYDFHLVLEALHRRSIPPKRLCTTGLKIYSMKLRGLNQRRITFKDSINYFFCELDGLVKSFDLPQHLATVKPFFPYLYIQRQHLLRRLNGLPAIEHYSPDTMKVEKRTKFLRWHGDNNADANFQLREQLILYCVNDVAILRESVLRFRQLIGEHTQGLDPFLCASTAAGLALATLRRCFLPANRLVHSPEGGYLRGRRASAESRRYIRFFELENEGAQVQCADWSIGEAHIEDSGYRVDGLWRRDPPLRPMAIEWMGCFYHGCPDCFPDRQQKLAAGRTAEDLYERTKRRLFELEHQHGCELHVIWGCQWKERLRRDHELKQRYEAVFTPCPLDPRNDALRGGRTEPFKLHHVCADDEEVLCIDIVSLYPYVMKVNPFPVGNPRVLTREVLLHPPTAPLPWTCPENNTFRGLLLVRVLAPRNIRVPLLGYRTKDERFTFPLCGVCADRRQQRPCRHGDDKRSWVCAYTHVELNKALQLGYVVTDLFEVWDYAEWDDTLFSSYVNSFVGLKVQASGWPEGCDTEEQRQAFVAEFLRTEGIHLDPTKVAFNPGLRLIAKTLANSLWGKLAQRVGHTEIQYTRTPAEFHKLIDDPTYDKLDFVHVSDHMDRVVVRKRPEFAKAPLTNCLPVAIFVTSYARLHLYGYMEQVLALNNAELLYCDTDSIYYVNKIGAPCVPEGEALGQMKREHVDRRIVEFVAGGPKNYGIRHTARDGTDERANLKIRSFRLSYATQQLINFDAMKELTLSTYNIDGPIDDVIDNDELFVYGGGAHRAIRVSFPQIDRNVQADLFTREAHKDYRPFYAKGRVRPGMQTRPFGFVEDAPQPMNVEEQPPPPPPPARRKRTLIEADPNQPGHSRWF